jgi:hypothetical protein
MFRRTAMDVTRWRLGDVAERLLGGRKRWDPPADWTCWAKPAPARLLTALRQSNRELRLRLREILAERGIACPYYGARWAIALAVDPATVSVAVDPADMVKRWRAHEEAAREERAGIVAIAESLVEAEKIPYSRWPLLEPPEVDREYSKISDELLLRLEEQLP